MLTPVVPAPQASVCETHSAVLFSMGNRVYKVKKPVDLGFLDFSTRELREAVCHREVALNRRLAPDVYLGVHDVLDEQGEPVEHVVVMRRLPADRSLQALLAAGQPLDAGLRDVARVLARFHSAADRSAAADAAGSLTSVQRNWTDSLTQLKRFVGPVLDLVTFERLRVLSEQYLAGRARLFVQRRELGRLCDGHGDLLAADIYLLSDGPRILDCIEFDDDLRYGDVLLDVAFLAMDLEDLGHPALGRQFLAAYEEHSGQVQPASLVHHYTAYRALVRSKVAALRWEQGDAASRDHSDRLARLAVRHLDAAQVRLVLVGGLPGTGKSTLAGELADERCWTLLRSDVVRKQSGSRARYDAGSTDAVYGTMLLRARAALALGESVVLDASWSDASWRDRAAQIAEDTCSVLVELQCEAPTDVADARMRVRAAHGRDASDAGPEVAREMATRFCPWPSAVRLDTTRGLQRTTERAQASHTAGGCGARQTRPPGPGLDALVGALGPVEAQRPALALHHPP